MCSPEDPSPPTVPAYLDSEETGRPFAACADCGTDLRTSGVPYSILKEVAEGETVCEFAVCMNCQAALLEELSEESIERLRQALADEGTGRFGEGFAEWSAALSGYGPVAEDSARRPEACQVCGVPLEPEGSLVLAALCREGHLLARVIARCRSCGAGPDVELSRQTRESLDDFFETILPGVPAQTELLFGVFGS